MTFTKLSLVLIPINTNCTQNSTVTIFNLHWEPNDISQWPVGSGEQGILPLCCDRDQSVTAHASSWILNSYVNVAVSAYFSGLIWFRNFFCSCRCLSPHPPFHHLSFSCFSFLISTSLQSKTSNYCLDCCHFPRLFLLFAPKHNLSALFTI